MDALAERFVEELTAAAGRRRRLLAAECDAALVEVSPQLRWDPGRRGRLRELLGDLAEADVLVWSAGRDRSVRPELPSFVTLSSAPRPQATGVGVGHPWRPELEWAHELRLTADEFAVLTAVQTYRRDRPASPPAIPHRERSLAVFGHEKRLDRLVRGRLFDGDRLSLALLDCWWAPPPLALQHLNDDGPIVVTENSSGYHSLPAALDGHVGVIAYGSGGSFAQSVASLAAFGATRPVLYIGDLDVEGVAIPQRAAAAAADAGVSVPVPFAELWAALVEAAPDVGQPAEPVPAEVAAELCEWFGPTALAKEVRRLLELGVRVAQEALTGEVLAGAARRVREH